MTPQRLVHDVRAVMPDDGIVCLDNACTRSGFARNYAAPTSPTRCSSTTRSPRWAPGLPSAMMAKLVHPERRVLAVCGDGGFMMNSQKLETAVA